ncbi:hypothetical protein SDC9_29421 [bioreactor metagenome]|uniref:Uncharacterized protein n=1 Tax=bioreactor metagenome TaxID=1076179 RepID=A0A644UWI6_9ZZZZ
MPDSGSESPENTFVIAGDSLFLNFRYCKAGILETIANRLL